MSHAEIEVTEAPAPDHNPWESRFGLTLAILAAVLAVNELGAGKFSEDELKESNEKASTYMWYQSKGIKETLAEGQRDMIQVLLKTGAIAPEHTVGIQHVAERLDTQIDRYRREKREILMGSHAVGQENWTQDVDGQLGQVVGCKEWEQEIARLNAAGDVFDAATLCLQLCMVLGAIGLLLRIPRSRALTFGAMLVLGSIGTCCCIRAYWMALA